MSSQLECKLKFESRVFTNIEGFNKVQGTYIVDIDDKKIVGYEETVKNHLPIAGTSYKPYVAYKEGSIVSYNNILYVSRRPFNKGHSVEDSFYWLKKEIKSANTGIGFNISNFISVYNGTEIDSKEASYNSSGSSKYNFRMIYDVDHSNNIAIPFIQSFKISDDGGPTNKIVEYGVYGLDYGIGINIYADSYDKSLMTHKIAVIAV